MKLMCATRTMNNIASTLRFTPRSHARKNSHHHSSLIKINTTKKSTLNINKYCKLICFATDYVGSWVDDPILQLPPQAPLQPFEIKGVFGFPRNIDSQFKVGDIIGAGSFGVVRLCTETATGTVFAVKTVGKIPKRQQVSNPRYLIKLRSEVEIMMQLGNSLDAVNLKAVYEDDKNIHMVMEVCEGGTLLERMGEDKHSERYIASIVRGILRFISQCHAKGVIYRDVKPENFLFKSDDADSHLKAIDFGLAIAHRPGEPFLKSRTGTPTYMAPEVINQEYSEKADLWSVGMLCFQLLTGRFPFWDSHVRGKTVQDVWDSILNDSFDWEAQDCKELSACAISFLQGLLERDVDQRMSAMQALQHPWIADESGAAEKLLKGSVVQRLQRFSTYGSLKQMVLKIMVDDLAEEAATRLPDAAKTSTESDTTIEESLEDVMLTLTEADDVFGDQPYSEARPMIELFHQMDLNGSGTITVDELFKGLQQQGYELSHDEVDRLMKQADLDSNGSVSLKEFLTILTDWSSIQQTRGWQLLVDSAFEKLDIDKNGFISVDELIGHLTDMGWGASSKSSEVNSARIAEAKHMLREADTDGDGLVSKEEFIQLLEDSLYSDALNFYDDRIVGHHLICE